MLATVDIHANPWAFHAHPEVWALVVCLVGAWIYSVRVIGPKAVPTGQPIVTRRQVWCFVATISMFWFASDWPMHDIGETYLYSVHMMQHMILSYFLPPLALLAMPEWLLRLIVGKGRGYTVLRVMTKPVVAGVLFNVIVMTTHIPAVVNASGTNAVLHYSLHLLLVTTALLMWMPVVGPFKELHMGYPGKMVYLFAQSVIPTVPAGWLTFADGVVYKRYNIPVRVWGLDVINDQQIAGAVMKVGGTLYLWAIIIYLFFKRFSKGFEEEQTYRRPKPASSAAPVAATEAASTETAAAAQPEPAAADTLTFEQVAEEFRRVPPAPEPERSF